MIEKAEIRRLVAGEWRAAGMEGRGGRWRFAGKEVKWLVEIQGNWLGQTSILADACVDSLVSDQQADDYPLRIFAEDLPAVDGYELAQALQLDSAMEDSDRLHVVRESARSLAIFVVAHGTLEALERAYRAGELKGALIRKDLRERLEESG